MAWDKMLFHPKELVDSNSLDDNPVGSGPFMLESFQRGVITKLKRNPDFFLKDSQGNQLPYLDGYEVIKILDPSTAVAAFVARQTDLCGMCLRGNPSLVERVKTGAPDAVWYSGEETGGIGELYMANNKPPFNDVKVRQALRLGLDVQGMLSALTQSKGRLNTAGVSTGYKEWALPENEVKALYPHDVAKAKDLMREAGYADGGPKFTVFVGSNSQPVITFTELLEAQMRAIGFDAKIQVVDFAEIITRRRANDFVMFISGKSQEIDPDGNLLPVYHSKGELNYSKISDAQLDQMLAKQRTILDVAERKKVIQDITRRIADQAFSLNPVMDERNIYWRPYVKGYHPHFYWGFGQKFMETWLDK
jgi:ABC-type transport system substrate-binding protein